MQIHIKKLTSSSLFVPDCSGLIQGKKVAEVADYLEQRCHCGISALYLQGEALFIQYQFKSSHLADF